ncbi:HAMP domain-containing sensor histidine kinase [Rhodobacteraceae bacterium DSL-40]|uniref:sensor histidine kinase n=1 Tax=Amaricoccus sp. B4 TaxID=3368557 RepID=UPI000DAD1125
MFLRTLSGRFLALTILFVMIAEILIFLPSIARFRLDYLQNRLDLAQIAALASLGSTEDLVPPQLERELLQTADVMIVVLQRDGVRELALFDKMPQSPVVTYDIRDPSPWALIRSAGRVLITPENRVIRVIGETRQGTEGIVDVVLNEAPLRKALIDYGLRIFYLSLVISVATASLLFLSVQQLIVRPINRVIAHMVAYRDNPEDTTRIIAPASGTRELNDAENALHDLEVRLTAALRQKERLAALGRAVAKISHDLRNMLTTAQLLVDSLEASPDPRVRRIAPKLVGSISRAVALCDRTLAYGKAEEPPPDIERFGLARLVNEVLEAERQTLGAETVTFTSAVPDRLCVRGDPDQLFRVLSNLVRNAAQAIAASSRPGTVRIEAEESDGRSFIRVSDTGPGLPPKARENLFQPFQGGVRQGGSGLGLVIAEEIVRGHGGTLSLEVSDEQGTTFAISLPAPPRERG